MRPSIEDLHDESKFTLIKSFHIDDTIKFLMGQLDNADKKEIKKPNLFQFILGLSCFALIGGIFGVGLQKMNVDIESLITQVGLSFIAMFIILLPIHEYIHGLTFKYYKAPKVGYGISLKAGMVYAYAQKFPISMPELRVLAIMPFAVITTLLIISLFIFKGYTTFIISLLMIHSLACIGDFALVRYAQKNINRAIYSYDDIETEKKTYFFEQI